MRLEGFTALPECSRKAQTTVDRARYWLSVLKIETVKNGNTRYVPDMAVDLLGTMARLVSSGMTPAEAAKKARDETPAEVPQIIRRQEENPAIFSELRDIKSALLNMAEKIRELSEENRALRCQVRTFMLPGNIQKVIPWEPPTRRDPLDGVPWYHRAWVSLVEPWKLRKSA